MQLILFIIIGILCLSTQCHLLQKKNNCFIVKKIES